MSTHQNRRILLIDDTPAIHEDFQRILCSGGPVAGTDLRSALDAAEEALFGETSERTVAQPDFDLDSAYQGADGLQLVRDAVQNDNPYALVFVDMRMPPGWDGLETITQIWKVDPRLQIVICTAHSDYSWDALLGKLGGEDRLLVLKKPFDSVEVMQLASALTTKWEMTRQAELKVTHLEDAVRERTMALEIANGELADLIKVVTRLANHDALTGLPNRVLFADRVSQALTAALRDGSRPAVLMLDLDRFKEVNDTLGHLHGDLLLCQVADRLSGVLRRGDTVARFGGDEFALLLCDGGPDVGTEVAVRIAKALEAPFPLGATSVSIEASIGIATVPDSADRPELTLEDLLRQADIAMYKAKFDRTGFAHYATCNDDGTPNRLTIVGELRQALDCEELVVYYQPKVAIDTGECLGVEALVRWQHPTRGLLLPSEFIPLAEGSTLIQRVTAFVIDSALRCCRAWLDQGLRLPVAVNIGARSLGDHRFPALINDRLLAAGVPPDLLTIELTEGDIMANPGAAVRILEGLRKTGVRLSVDDYGTGYASLAYLKNLPVTELKIDLAYVKGLTNDPHNAAIVQSATELGHNLGLSVVAEGVEDERTLATLRSIGVDVAQGHYLSHPLTERLLEQWIRHRAIAPGPSSEDPHLKVAQV